MDSESELTSVIYQMVKFLEYKGYDPSEELKTELKPELISFTIQIMKLVNSMDLYSKPQSKSESMFLSSLKRIISVSKSISDSDPEWEFISLVTQVSSLTSSKDRKQQSKLKSLIPQTFSHLKDIGEDSELERSIGGLIAHVNSLAEKSSFIPPLMKFQLSDNSMDTESELMYVIYQVVKLLEDEVYNPSEEFKVELKPEVISYAIQAISLFNSMDLDSQPESRFISSLKRLLTASWSVSEFEPEWGLITLVAQMSSIDTMKQPEAKVESLMTQILKLLKDTDEYSELRRCLSDLVTHVVSLGVEEEKLEEEIRSLIPPAMNLQLVPGSKLIPNIIQFGFTQLHVTQSSVVLDSSPVLEAELVSLLSQMLNFVKSDYFKRTKKVKPEFISSAIQAMSLFKSMDLDSKPEDSTFMSSLKRLISVSRLISDSEPEWELISLVTQMSSLTNSKQEPTLELVSLVTQIYHHFRYLDEDSMLIEVINNLSYDVQYLESEVDVDGESEFMTLIHQTADHYNSVMNKYDTPNYPSLMANIIQLVYLLKCLDLASEPKYGVGILPLISQLIYTAKSVSYSEPEWELVSLATRMVSLILCPNEKSKQCRELEAVISKIFTHLKRFYESKLRLALDGIYAHLQTLEPDSEEGTYELISLSPQSKVEYVTGKFRIIGQVRQLGKAKVVACKRIYREPFCLGTTKDKQTHFRCTVCNGEKHGGHEKAPVKIQHPLHPKHYLQLVHRQSEGSRKCYCCDEYLLSVFYYCSTCDFAINIACVEKQLVAAIDHPKWHEHKLQLFPRRAFLTCNLCALADLSSPIYMCPPCDFVAHLRCINLPRVIRICRHRHRISFTSSFVEGDWSCGVCRKKIDNDYGGYSCQKEGCLYMAHSRCAIQSNIWDGKELDGEPDEIEEEVLDPFVKISDGVIEHFLHQHHHLRLDKDTWRDYDDNKQCSACVTPIYVGNVYSCVECEFILHEECAKLSRKVHHPTHAHLLTLEGPENYSECAVCPRPCEAGFTYKCNTGYCSFRLHVQCSTTSEPLLHESHRHPLFLTSKPEERRTCGVCRYSKFECTNETFNCIEGCDFALCFKCATIPQKARYKHDKHVLALSYGEETSTLSYWCEICEGKIDPKKRFYTCAEYCCVTLHMECLIGIDLYVKPNSSCRLRRWYVDILPNSHRMSRPICLFCEKRCLYKIFLEYDERIYCSSLCLHRYIARG